MLITRRALSLSLWSSASLTTTTKAFMPPPSTRALHSTVSLSMAAPGVVLSSTADIQQALSNKDAIVLDARRVDEIQANGYFSTTNCQWVHAPCTPDGDCPILAAAADALLRDKTAPIIVYCASGKRASVAQSFLQERGYTTVLNAGGYPGDFGELL